jgi:hypothetical protein
MKRTTEDREFASKFAAALRPHVSAARGKGKSWSEIGAALGITAAGLRKQLAGGTPSVRTIALAYHLYKISVRYRTVAVGEIVCSKKKENIKRTRENQLSLPFEITAPPDAGVVTLELEPRSVHRYFLRVVVQRSA